MIDWFDTVKRYYIGGFYTDEQVLKFVEFKKITEEQAQDILKAKEEQKGKEVE